MFKAPRVGRRDPERGRPQTRPQRNQWRERKRPKCSGCLGQLEQREIGRRDLSARGEFVTKIENKNRASGQPSVGGSRTGSHLMGRRRAHCGMGKLQRQREAKMIISARSSWYKVPDSVKYRILKSESMRRSRVTDLDGFSLSSNGQDGATESKKAAHQLMVGRPSSCMDMHSCMHQPLGWHGAKPFVWM